MCENEKIDAVDVVSYSGCNEVEADEAYLIPSRVMGIIILEDYIRIRTWSDGGYNLVRESRTLEMLRKYFNFIDPTKEESKNV